MSARRRGQGALLDCELLRRRRRELGISLRALAKALGATPPVIVALERGDNHGDLPLSQVLALAEALALSPAELFAAPPGTPLAEPAPKGASEGPADAAERLAPVLAALLHTTGVLTSREALAEATGHDLPTVTSALDHLEVMLSGTGLRVHQLAGDVALARTATAVDPELLRTLLRLHHDRRSVTLSEAQALSDIVRGRIKNVNGSNARRVALGAVTNAGHVRTDALELSSDCRFSLFLDDESETRTP